MTLSQQLDALAARVGAGTLEGALIFVCMERTLDRLIRYALALGPYHPGQAGPWSHVFLLAEPYHGPGTGIIECSVRTKGNKIIWDEDHKIDPIKILWHKDVKSGICTGTIADYDDPRVTNAGIKWLPALTTPQRDTIITNAQDPRWEPYHYDFPGLLRELIRLVSGGTIDPPPGHRLLFCSAFVQRVYSLALGQAGDFAVRIRDDDTTPDDLWYSPLGEREPNV
jgi:hypothetical protein